MSTEWQVSRWKVERERCKDVLDRIKSIVKSKILSKPLILFDFFILDYQITKCIFNLALWICENTLPTRPSIYLIFLSVAVSGERFFSWPTATFQTKGCSWGRGTAACWPERSVVKPREPSPCFSDQPVVSLPPYVPCHFPLRLILLESFSSVRKSNFYFSFKCLRFALQKNKGIYVLSYILSNQTLVFAESRILWDQS